MPSLLPMQPAAGAALPPFWCLASRAPGLQYTALVVPNHPTLHMAGPLRLRPVSNRSRFSNSACPAHKPHPKLKTTACECLEARTRAASTPWLARAAVSPQVRVAAAVPARGQATCAVASAGCMQARASSCRALLPALQPPRPPVAHPLLPLACRRPAGQAPKGSACTATTDPARTGAQGKERQGQKGGRQGGGAQARLDRLLCPRPPPARPWGARPRRRRRRASAGCCAPPLDHRGRQKGVGRGGCGGRRRPAPAGPHAVQTFGRGWRLLRVPLPRGTLAGVVASHLPRGGWCGRSVL